MELPWKKLCNVNLQQLNALACSVQDTQATNNTQIGVLVRGWRTYKLIQENNTGITT